MGKVKKIIFEVPPIYILKPATKPLLKPAKKSLLPIKSEVKRK